MMDILQILLSESFWAASLRIATPLIFGVLGALICEKSGVLNLGIEGIFVVGAMSGWMAVWLGAGLWGGVLVAALAGGFFGLNSCNFDRTTWTVAACIWSWSDAVCNIGKLFFLSDGFADCHVASKDRTLPCA